MKRRREKRKDGGGERGVKVQREGRKGGLGEGRREGSME